ncbi:hypothetical protein FKP32DRAFT_1664550 [Trametes sanguinea]|nr:hypothetical protein FKP32DRAFT_1664550 [Trametes sanguinea]
MSRIPPSLLYLTIYNPTLKPATLYPDDEDAEEIAHVLFHTAREHAVSRDRVLRQVGLAKALVNFSEMFNAGVPCENVHSQARRMIMLSPEPNFWIHACYELAKTPRPPPSTSKLKDGSKSKSKGKEKAQPSQPAVLYDYHDGSLHDEALRTHFQRGYEDFKLLYGSFTSVLANPSLGQEALELQLERFFTIWAWKWDIEDENFGTHLGVPLHPLHDRLTPLLEEFASKLPQELVTFALIPPYVIPPRTPRYPAALVRYVLSRIPPPPTPLARNNSTGPVPTSIATAESGKPPATTASPPAKQESQPNESAAASTILGMPALPPMNLGLDMKNLKWWPGYLTFGKSNAGSKSSTAPQTPPAGAAVVTPPTPRVPDPPAAQPSTVAPEGLRPDAAGEGGATRETLEVDTASLLEAISTESMGSHTRAASPAPSTLSRSTQLPESSGRNTGEGASSPGGASAASSPVHEQGRQAGEAENDVAPQPERMQQLPGGGTDESTRRPAYSFLRSIVHLASERDPLATEKKHVLHLTHCGCTVAIVVDVDHTLDDPTTVTVVRSLRYHLHSGAPRSAVRSRLLYT